MSGHRNALRAFSFATISLACACALALPAWARTVAVPLQLDHEFLRQALLTQMYTGPGQTAQVWSDGTGCNFLTLSDPQVGARDGRLRITSAGSARVGTQIGGMCLTVLDWTGTVEALEDAVLDPQLPIIRFRVADSNLYAPDGAKQVTGRLWDWVKDYVHPRLEAVSIDLYQPVDELRAFLPLVLPTEDAARTQALLDSLALAGARVSDAGLAVDVRFDVAEPAAAPAAPVPAMPMPEPTLSPEELQRWEAAWQQWDAFLTFVAKQAAGDTAAHEQRLALLAVLLEARYDLTEALAPGAPHAEDPVRPLFLKTWTRLAPVLRQLSLGLPGETALRYLSFITAADALRALDEAGPDVGLDISADGLRRLARMVAPASVEDPLAYSVAVDPVLRQLFGFGDPLSPPEPNPDVDLSAWLVAPAWAVGPFDPRLKRWVPTRDDVSEYLPLMHALLLHTAAETLGRRPLDAEFHALYEDLVLATAWQESCWRQFIRQDGKIKPIRSAVGSVGLMQVNERVWRGFYELTGLREDIGYNARAGEEILLHYLRDYAIAKREHTATGNVDNLARAAYAVYNGGPGHLTRYRKAKAKKSLRAIDVAFWTKYQEIKAGHEMAVAACYGKG